MAQTGLLFLQRVCAKLSRGGLAPYKTISISTALRRRRFATLGKSAAEFAAIGVSASDPSAHSQRLQAACWEITAILALARPLARPQQPYQQWKARLHSSADYAPPTSCQIPPSNRSPYFVRAKAMNSATVGAYSL